MRVHAKQHNPASNFPPHHHHHCLHHNHHHHDLRLSLVHCLLPLSLLPYGKDNRSNRHRSHALRPLLPAVWGMAKCHSRLVGRRLIVVMVKDHRHADKQGGQKREDEGLQKGDEDLQHVEGYRAQNDRHRNPKTQRRARRSR